MEPIDQTFVRIVREYQAGLRAYVRRLGIVSDWVDDVAQEVFLVAYRRWGDFDRDRDLGSWLYGIARHLVANELRKGRRRARVVYTPLADRLLEAAEAAPPDVCQREPGRLLEFLRECLQRLPQAKRDLLYQRYAEPANAQALSERLRVSPGAVRLQLMRIRALVKACVEGKLREVAS